MVKQLAGTNQNSNPLTGIPNASASTDAVPFAQMTAAITAAINANNLATHPICTVIGNSSTLSANPSTYIPGLANTTWMPYAAGRTMVGKAASGTFATAGANVGSETHTLTVGEMPVHSHGNDSHNHSIPRGWYTYTGTGGYGIPGGGVLQYTDHIGDTRTNWSTINIHNNGGGGAHNNIQPSVVAYMWERTA